ncbi:hypothetical protein XELAEV_18017052mg [Xenopus laevis]|uniref:Uncharacterized protein n=1 Tax=Xenopus laevis TaxID=8355 RepID=A0A974DCF4_XENLA|nr:hypothetical protein XELAEV_18017052mg [Xenopus laevis]
MGVFFAAIEASNPRGIYEKNLIRLKSFQIFANVKKWHHKSMVPFSERQKRERESGMALVVSFQMLFITTPVMCSPFMPTLHKTDVTCIESARR